MGSDISSDCPEATSGLAATKQLDDGLSYATSALFSDVLIQPETGKEIRVLALHLEIAGKSKRVWAMDRMEYVSPDSSQPLVYNVGGVSPSLASAGIPKGTSAHSYQIVVAPKNEKVWAAAKGDFDLDFLFVRTK